MYLPIEPQPSCARAWLAAAKQVHSAPGHEAHNVIIGVANPVDEVDGDHQIIEAVDLFLRDTGKLPLQSVANTIFPQALFDRYGAPDFYDIYLHKVYPRIKRHADWGRYFERMISFPLQKKGETINPLRDLVDKMKGQVRNDRCFKNVYELTIYDPIRDAGPVMNRQCLSFLSFKLVDGSPRRLLLTAVYRNHYYTERLLGNLIGLGRLMNFVANEAGVVVGDLTIVSTHAVVDSPASRTRLTSLLNNCAADIESKSMEAV